MRLLVIADIHANHAALRAAWQTAQSLHPDGVIFLGDYVTDCPCPQKTMALLRAFKQAYRCWFIRGNREEYLLRHRDHPQDDWTYCSQTGALLYTYENLTQDDLDFFAAMPICMDIALPDAPVITACHAAPDSSRVWIYDDTEAITRHAQAVRGDVLLLGHTHHQAIHALDSKLAVFCPSIGMPQMPNCSENLTLLTLQDGAWQADFISAPWNISEIEQDFSSCGLYEKAPVWSRCVLRSLQTRREWCIWCLQRAEALAKQDGCHQFPIPERYWEAAAHDIL